MTTWRIPFKRAWDWRNAGLTPDAASKLERDWEYVEKALNALQAGSGGGATTVYTSDAFTRSANPIGTSDASLGGAPIAWASHTGTWKCNGTAQPSDGEVKNAASVDVGFANVSVQCILNPRTQNFAEYLGIACRVTDALNHYYLAALSDGGGGCGIYFGKLVAGTNTVFNAAGVVPSFVNGGSLRMTCVGTTITAYVNGFPFWVATDTSHSVQTKHGMHHHHDNLAGPANQFLGLGRIDNFVVTAPY